MTISRLGFKIYLDMESLYPHLVTPILFLGPLYARYLGYYLPFQKYWSFQTDIVSRFFCWQGARNYLFVRLLRPSLYVRLRHVCHGTPAVRESLMLCLVLSTKRAPDTVVYQTFAPTYHVFVLNP
jgi:hypothetical protein